MISRLITLSTVHITPATLNNIAAHVCSYANEYGAFVWVDEGLDDAPNDLQELIQFARKQNADWIKLDADAPAVEGLATYASYWEPPEPAYILPERVKAIFAANSIMGDVSRHMTNDEIGIVKAAWDANPDGRSSFTSTLARMGYLNG
jgi:hypothetical protein